MPSERTASGAENGAALLAQLRQQAGLTQGQLAERAGISRSMVAQLEMAERRPSRKALGRLGEALRLSTEDTDNLQVAFGFTPEGDTPEQIAAFLRADKRLSPEAAERLATVMREAYDRAIVASITGEVQASNKPSEQAPGSST